MSDDREDDHAESPGERRHRGSRASQANRSDVSAFTTLSGVRSLVGDVLDDVATLLDAELEEDVTKPLHTVAVVFNLSNTTMGVGILSLASAFALAGLVLGPILMVLCAVATYFSVLLLVRIVHAQRVPADASGVPTMEAVAEYCLGPKGKIWVQAVLVLICLGTLVAYLVSVKSLFYSGIKEVLPKHTVDTLEDHGLSNKTCMLMALVLVSLPLSLLRRLDGLWFTSFLSVLSLLYFIIISVEYYATTEHIDSCSEKGELVTKDDPLFRPTSATDAFQAFSIISVSYICQLTVFPIFKELAKGQRGGGSPAPVKAASGQLLRATWVTMVISCTFYLVAGVLGYITWRDVTTKPSTILACYPPSVPSVTVVYFGMTLVLLFSFPLICFTCRCTIAQLFYKEMPHLNTVTHVGLTLLICAPCAGVAYVATSLTSVLGVVSAVTSPSLCFLLPGICYIRASAREREFASQEASGAPKQPSVEASPHVNADEEDGACADPLLERSEEELEFVAAERRQLAASVAGGYVVAGLGVAMQIACIVGVVFSITGGSSDSPTPAPTLAPTPLPTFSPSTPVPSHLFGSM